ncbi:MAG: hypothetical protein M3N18_06560 [Actinomycetota bacterium]|nr:hypothetical protein [Actinomycetota bacterium]
MAGLGVGPRPVPRARLSVEQLAGALRQATVDAEMIERARSLVEKIRAEDDVQRAVEAFHRLVARRRVAGVEAGEERPKVAFVDGKERGWIRANADREAA